MVYGQEVGNSITFLGGSRVTKSTATSTPADMLSSVCGPILDGTNPTDFHSRTLGSRMEGEEGSNIEVMVYSIEHIVNSVKPRLRCLSRYVWLSAENLPEISQTL